MENNLHPDMLIPATEMAAVISAIRSLCHQTKRKEQQSSSGPLLVAITGVPGSGKTTFAKRLVEQLNHLNSGPSSSPAEPSTSSSSFTTAVCLPMDGYHLYREELAAMPNAEEAFQRRGAEWTFSPKKLHADLHTLLTTGELYAPDFDHAAKDPVEQAIHVGRDAKIVVMEGLYLNYRGTKEWEAVAGLFDLHIFLSVPSLDLSTERLARRHMRAWGISHEDALARASGSDLLNAKLVLTTEVNASMVCHSLESSSL